MTEPARDAAPEERWTEIRTDPASRSLGRYTLFYEIGAGGMASVFLARESGPAGFQRWVAIKRIHPHLAREQKFVEMFLDEARLAARIAHPNVTQVLELGEAAGTWFLAMEYLHGETVAALARAVWRSGERLPWGVTVRITAQACEGLHHAHDLTNDAGQPLGLVHRDVSPQNLIVTYSGVVKVMDFGIAKAAGRVTHTQTGGMKGKIPYMSPEQARGEPLDRRSDVFSLGIVLWELSTGRRLFKEESEYESMRRIVEADVQAPSALGATIPAQLERIIMRALSRRPAERYTTAADMQRELEALLASRGQVVGAAELSALMRKTFADRIRIREQLLRTTTVPAGAEAPTVEVASGESLTFESGLRPGHGRRVPWAVTATAVLALLAGVVLAVVLWPQDPAPGPAATPMQTVVRSTAAPPTQVPAPAASAAGSPTPFATPALVPSATPSATPSPTPSPSPTAAPSPSSRSGRTASSARGPRVPAARTTPPQPAAVQAVPGFLNVMTSPWSTVFVDGARMGTTPLVRRSIASGSHTVRLVWEDGRSTTARVAIRPRETTSLRRDAP